MNERIAALIAGADRDVLLEFAARIYGDAFAHGVGVPPPESQPPELAALMPQVRQRHTAGYDAQQRVGRASIHRQARPPLGWPEDPDR